jgi:hypothetical protein
VNATTQANAHISESTIAPIGAPSVALTAAITPASAETARVIVEYLAKRGSDCMSSS